MERSWYWRLLLVVGLVALSAFYAAPSTIYFLSDPEVRRSEEKLKEAIPQFLPSERLNFGIDLQGGLHLVMGVDTEKAMEDRADRVAEEIQDAMKEKGKPLAEAGRKGNGPALRFELAQSDDWDVLKDILEDRRDTWDVTSRLGTEVLFSMRSEYEERLRGDVVEQALKTVRNRIDTFGVKEPQVRRQGDNSIVIQIAGVTAETSETIKNDIIGRTAQLEFKIVDDQSTYFQDLAGEAEKPESITLQVDTFEGPGGALVNRPFLESPDKDVLRAFLDKHPPPADREVAIQEFRESQTSKEVLYRTWLLDRRTPLTGDALVDAYVAFDSEENQYNVHMKLDKKGAVIFERLTRENTKRKVGIVLDDILDSAPLIQTPIPDGRVRITLGGFKSKEEILADAKALSIVLKAGALPAPLYQQEERTVGATLGDDAVAKGKIALGTALLLVMFMLGVYYRLSGGFGMVALGVNLLLLFAALSAFGATLTLPGIAGLALTVGMAVDANIIQFERIREELRLGKTIRAAVEGGFDKAFSAIFDANFTTLIACVILYQEGSGPIKGFALTLGFGTLINTFTAVVVPRLGLSWVARRRGLAELSI